MTVRALQTVAAGSWLGRLDFRTKLVVMIVSGILALLWDSPILLAALVCVLAGAVLSAGVRWQVIRALGLTALPLAVMLIGAHGLWNVAQVKTLIGPAQLTRLISVPDHWWLIGSLRFTLEGAVYGAAVLLKSLALALAVPLVVFTTETSHMVVALTQMGVPYKLAFVFSATLRFFPLLMTEIQSITEAQRLRGLDLTSMGPLKRVRIYGQMAVPLVLGALLKSQQMEIALQSRAFSGRRDRTYLHTSSLGVRDILMMVLLSLAVVGALWGYRSQGIGSFAWLLFE
jgi:energy-coupling factor transport system permease protein